jgi:hypothetical protein
VAIDWEKQRAIEKAAYEKYQKDFAAKQADLQKKAAEEKAAGFQKHWDDKKHPRLKAGTPDGGQFAFKDEEDYEDLGNLDAEKLQELSKQATGGELLDEEASLAVKRYVDTSAFEDINKSLREGTELKDRHGLKMKDILSGMDKAIKSSKAPKNFAVYRALRGPKIEKLMFKLKAGEVLTDPGIISTTTDKAVAQEFFELGRGRTNFAGATMKILVPKGARALIPGPYTYRNDAEDEVILPRGAKFKLIGRRKAEFVFQMITK